ncbi:hypothetical protein Pse7367_2991 [Thalassoporum mexicanum PCC 7367]|uniref:hypothetical protein n=1 Tax=Thalassoporum mexicanum TaxID=3457544 RepID=UPI00029F8074|nr:hypothetical protein [Pseudanabaena sp. PCC 7367]AFY71242.1 hypothetical protein Pse7367_2991 [Pseudanabaena sp. PCC 7367]
MIKTILKLPFPSTTFECEPTLKYLIGRDHELVFVLLDEEDNKYEYSINFEGIEAYKCTYLSSISAEMVEAYDKLIDCGRSDWLIEIEKQCR